MGGFAGSLLKGMMERTTSGGMGESIAKAGVKAWEFLGSKENIRALHPHADAVMDLDAAFVKARNENFQKLQEPVQKLWNGIKQDPQLSQKLGGHSTMRDVHSELATTGHPLVQHSSQILNQNVHPKTGVQFNADHDFELMGVQNHAQASRMASDQVYGPHYQNMIPYIQDLYETGDPRDKATADLLIRVVSNETHDTILHGGADKSRAGQELREAFGKENKQRQKLGGGKQLPLPSAKPTYTKKGELERTYQSMMVNRLAGLAVIPHLSMVGNLASSPLTDIIKGLSSMGDQQIKDLSTSAGILGNTMYQIFYNDVVSRSGQTAKIIGQGPAAFFYKMFHMPAFNTVRMWQLSLSASVGYHSATDWAMQATKGSKIAIERLKEFKLDPQQIIQQGGKLTEDQMKQSMFHYVNNRMFIDRPMDRSLQANANVYHRSATMFHSIVSSQSRFIRRELQTMWKAGDVKGIAQFAGTIGVLMPATMPWIHGLEVMGRTASPSQGLATAQKDYKSLAHPDSAKEFALTYLDMLSYLGGFGIWHSMIHAAWGDRLATTLLGPMFGPLATTGADVIKAATKPTKDKKINPYAAPNEHPHQKWNVVGRDLSELAVPIVGKWAGHKLFPTLAEERAEKPKLPHRRGRRR